ncbi:MAG: tetratricopeptide repeat protein [Candidatus Oxydemutatoraceae bacterium WSBS_2016_MAG_OTU14]
MSIFLLVLHYNLFQSEYFYRLAAISVQKPGGEEESMQAARKAYEYNPIRTKLIWYEAMALLKSGRYDIGVPLMEKVSSQYPYSKDTLLNLATAYIKQKKYAKASEKYAELFEVQEAWTRNLGNYLHILGSQGRYETMVKAIDKELPRYSEVLDTMKRFVFKYGNEGDKMEQIIALSNAIKSLKLVRERAVKNIAQEAKKF